VSWHERRKDRQCRALTERRKTVTPTDSRILNAARQPEVVFAIMEHRGYGMTVPEVALRLGLSVNGVKLIEKRALDKVRRALGAVK
jgi:DNA-directed RNA polymerase specialized sigma24 family protein